MLETISPNDKSICLRPTTKMIMKSCTKDVQERNLTKELQRRVSAPAKCTRVTDLDLAAARVVCDRLYASKGLRKSIGGPQIGRQSLNMELKMKSKMDYVDMDGTRYLTSKDLNPMQEQNSFRRASTSAMMTTRYPEYHNLTYIKSDDKLDPNHVFLRFSDRLKRNAIDSRRIKSAPADFTFLIETSLPQNRSLSCSNNNSSYVIMNDCKGKNEEDVMSNSELCSKGSTLTTMENGTPEISDDSGISSYGSIHDKISEMKSSNSDASSETSDDLYRSCRTNLSQSKGGKISVKSCGVGVKTTMQSLAAKIPLKKGRCSSAFPKSTTSMPNIHNAAHRRFQKKGISNNSHTLIGREAHTKINMLTNESFQEALDNPIKIPSLKELTVPEDPITEIYSRENTDKNCKYVQPSSVQRSPDNFMNSTKSRIIDLPFISTSRSNFLSAPIRTIDEVPAVKKCCNDYVDSSYFSNIGPKIEKKECSLSKNSAPNHTAITIEHLANNEDFPNKILPCESNSGIFSVTDLLIGQRSQNEEKRSESILGINSSSETTTTNEPARRNLRLHSSTKKFSSLSMSNGSNSFSNTTSPLQEPVICQLKHLSQYGQNPSRHDPSCTPCLQISQDKLLRTSTSLRIPHKQTNGVLTQSQENYCRSFMNSDLEPTSSSSLLECQDSPKINPANVNASSEFERTSDRSNLFQKSNFTYGGALDRSQLLRYLFRSRSLAFQSHPLQPLLQRLSSLEFRLIHAPQDIKLMLAPYPPTLSALLIDYYNKRPKDRASIAAVLPRRLLQPVQCEAQMTDSPATTGLPTLHKVMLEVIASIHYSIVDIIAKRRTSYVMARKPQNVRHSSSIQNAAENFPANLQNSGSIYQPVQNTFKHARRYSTNSHPLQNVLINPRSSYPIHHPAQYSSTNIRNYFPVPNSTHHFTTNVRSSQSIHCSVNNGLRTPQNSSSILHPSRHLTPDDQSLSTISPELQNQPESCNSTGEPITLRADAPTAPSSTDVHATRSSCSVFYKKLPSFV